MKNNIKQLKKIERITFNNKLKEDPNKIVTIEYLKSINKSHNRHQTN